MATRNRAPLFRRADSPYWWVHIYVDGRRCRVSTKCTDRTAAGVEAVRLQREAVDPRPRDFTVTQTLATYLAERTDWAPRTATRSQCAAAALNRGLGEHLTAKLTREDLERYRASRPARTAENEQKLLLAAIKAARRRGEAVPDIERLKLAPQRRDTEQRTRWLTRAEIERLTAYLHPDRADWVTLACFTGLRLSELNGLGWEHFNIEAELLRAPGTKSKRSKRTIPLSDTVMALLRRRQADGLPPAKPWIKPYGVLNRATAKLGLERVIPHDFRRTFASWLLQGGVGHHAIADLLGHQGMDLVRSVYAHLGAADLRAAIKVLS